MPSFAAGESGSRPASRVDGLGPKHSCPPRILNLERRNSAKTVQSALSSNPCHGRGPCIYPLNPRDLSVLTDGGRGGRSSVVERQLPKLDVVGSIPIARSISSTRPGPRDIAKSARDSGPNQGVRVVRDFQLEKS